MTTRSPARAIAFGPLGLELGPRALSRAAAPEGQLPPGAPGCATFALRAEGVTAELRERLMGLAGARLQPVADPGRPTTPDRWYRCEREALAALAASEALAELLLDCLEAQAGPPAPTRLMGIVNVTPDSFSDGGLHHDPRSALAHGLRLAEEGAELLDVGGESTRPGAAEVSVQEEQDRVLPVIEGLAAAGVARISVDTRKSAVARAALEAGAHCVNDVSAGLHDPEMLPVVARAGCDYVAMHMQGEPGRMQEAPRYSDVVSEVTQFLRERVASCLKAGIQLPKIHLDPGIGFGKRPEHNLALLRRLSELRSLGLPLCLGVSRKSFIAHVSGAEGPEDWKRMGLTDRAPERIGGTAAAIAFCVLGGAEILRVHDVREMAEAAAVARAIARG